MQISTWLKQFNRVNKRTAELDAQYFLRWRLKDTNIARKNFTNAKNYFCYDELTVHAVGPCVDKMPVTVAECREGWNIAWFAVSVGVNISQGF